ncbi:MAG TPA: ATP-binding protein [Candidatus Paceibacterota bacterium]|nr:ATP-binding protein [Candidatus Paceibacterota bacterium]
MPNFPHSYVAGLAESLKRHRKIGLLLFVTYMVALWTSDSLVPNLATLFPASAIAMATLFFTGPQLWPVVYLASFASNVFLGSPLSYLVIMPIAQALQAGLGAYALRSVRIDPLFRRSRDILSLLAIVFVACAIVPSLGILARSLHTLITDIPFGNISWFSWYFAAFFCHVIIVPFILRWFAKPRFMRSPQEVIELVLVFSTLLVIEYMLFIEGAAAFGPIPLSYLLLFPLFWIALRMRPRFITLALLLTSLIAIASLYISPGTGDPVLFSTQLLQTQVFLVVLALIFFVIACLEEDRRLSANLMRSQLATLENAVARVSSESRAKNDFITILAHELRNPLAPIASAIDLLRLSGSRSKDELETLTMMEDRMQIIRRLLDDLLDISRISEGKIELKSEEVALDTVLKRAVLSTQHLFTERHQTFTVKTPKHQLYVQGDAVRLEQIVSNLLTNASKYSNSGDAVRLELGERENEAVITVTDEGLGIDPKDLNEIFTPFHQIENGSRTKKGVGIGLALVRSFVEMHGGRVSASSKGQGHGSRFTVTLPLSASNGARAVTKKSHDPVARDPKRTNLHVLVVDDNDAAAWGVGRLLELRGCSVSYAYTGGQAIDEMARLSPDIAILDLGLPDQDGYAVAKTIRARGFRGRLIALTGFSTDEAREKGRETGFEHYLTKPTGLEDLKRAIPEIA